MMQLPRPIVRALLRCVNWYTARRAPDQPIGEDYLLRWWLTPWRRWFTERGDPNALPWWHIGRWPNIYLHKFHRSDYDRALHDHPFGSISIVLGGGYWEWLPLWPDQQHSPDCSVWRAPGSITFRRATDRHRIELPEDVPEAVTIFITGWRKRQWGFHCSEGWRSYPEWDERGGCD